MEYSNLYIIQLALNHRRDYFVDYNPHENIRIIDTREDEEPKFLLFDEGGYCIVNKFSTQGFLQTLNAMNESVYFHDHGNGTATMIKAKNDDIPVYFNMEYLGRLPAPIVGGGYVGPEMIPYSPQ